MIYYLCYFGNFNKNISSVAAADTMISYVSEALTCKNDDVIILSPTKFVNKKSHSKMHIEKLNDKITYINSPIISASNILMRKFGTFYSLYWVYKYLKNNIREGDTLVVYHSLILQQIVKKIKRINKCKIVLQINEIHTNFIVSKKQKDKEKRYFNVGDAYIFSTEMLNEKVNVDNKPYAVIYGTYKIEKKYKEQISDNKIHCVYAGTFSQSKAGVFNAIDLASYLSSRYCINVVGQGKEDEIEIVKKLISASNDKNECKVYYDGMKYGKDYLKYVQQFQIGLSTQNPIGDYNDTSFPSKILSYLSNGLMVLSIDIPVVKRANLGEAVVLYNNDSRSSLLERLDKLDILDKPVNPKETLINLDKKAKNDIAKILESEKQHNENKHKQKN